MLEVKRALSSNDWVLDHVSAKSSLMLAKMINRIKLFLRNERPPESNSSTQIASNKLLQLKSRMDRSARSSTRQAVQVSPQILQRINGFAIPRPAPFVASLNKYFNTLVAFIINQDHSRFGYSSLARSISVVYHLHHCLSRLWMRSIEDCCAWIRPLATCLFLP